MFICVRRGCMCENGVCSSFPESPLARTCPACDILQSSRKLPRTPNKCTFSLSQMRKVIVEQLRRGKGKGARWAMILVMASWSFPAAWAVGKGSRMLM